MITFIKYYENLFNVISIYVHCSEGFIKSIVVLLIITSFSFIFLMAYKDAAGKKKSYIAQCFYYLLDHIDIKYS